MKRSNKKENTASDSTNAFNNTEAIAYYWTCDICDGDSESGCMYFDVTECPRVN